VWLCSTHDVPVYKRLVLDELIAEFQPRAAAQIRRVMTIANGDVLGAPRFSPYRAPSTLQKAPDLLTNENSARSPIRIGDRSPVNAMYCASKSAKKGLLSVTHSAAYP
jgi:hypothetical protein